jgi:hypothetical protein
MHATDKPSDAISQKRSESGALAIREIGDEGKLVDAGPGEGSRTPDITVTAPPSWPLG